MTTLYRYKLWVKFIVFPRQTAKPALVRGRTRKQGDTPTHLAVLGVSTTMDASLPGARFQGNSDFKNSLRYTTQKHDHINFAYPWTLSIRMGFTE